jgi:hypothetical protein
MSRFPPLQRWGDPRSEAGGVLAQARDVLSSATPKKTPRPAAMAPLAASQAGGIAAIHRRHAPFPVLPLGGRRWEADTIERASLNTEKAHGAVLCVRRCSPSVGWWAALAFAPQRCPHPRPGLGVRPLNRATAALPTPTPPLSPDPRWAPSPRESGKGDCGKAASVWIEDLSQIV